MKYTKAQKKEFKKATDLIAKALVILNRHGCFDEVIDKVEEGLYEVDDLVYED